MRVLLLETRTRARHELLGMLTELAVSAQGVAAVDVAIERVRAGQVEIVVLGECPDSHTPEQVARQLRAAVDGAPLGLIALVPKEEEHRSIAPTSGLDEVLTTPVNILALGAALDQVQRDVLRSTERLRKPAELLMQLFEHAPDGYLLADSDARIIATNPALVELTGYSDSELRGETIQGLGLVLEADTQLRESDPMTGLLGSNDAPVEFTLVTKDWKHVAVELQTFRVRLARWTCLLGVVRNLAIRNRAERRRGEAVVAALAHDLRDALLVVSSDGIVRFAGPPMEHLLQIEPADLVGVPVLELVHPDDRPELEAALPRGAQTSWQRREVRMRRADDSWAAVLLSLSRPSDAPGLDGVVLTLSSSDLETASSAPPAETDGLASNGFYSLYDPVTALPNRMLFLDRLDHALERAARYQHLLTVLVVDVDGLRAVNQRHGPGNGDQLLSEISLRIHHCLREDDTAARIGGAEFAVLAEGVGGAAEGRLIAERLLEALRAQFAVDDEPVALRASVGLALAQQGSQNAGVLLRQAQDAAAQARQQGGSRCVVHQPAQHRQTPRTTLDLNGDLKRAIEQGELEIHYQPEVDLRSGAIIAVEALLRWEHPKHGLILPGEFLGFAEESGLIARLGCWVLDQATQQVAVWRRRYRAAREMLVSVNISPIQLHDPGFVEQVAGALVRAGLPPDALRLETTGALVLNGDARLISSLGALRELGVHVALQDVDASIWDTAQLSHIPADTLKIDRSLVGGIVANEARPSLRQPLHAYAEAAGLAVVISGIETANHLARARIFKHRHGQGFYFFRPVPARSMEFILSRGALPGTLGALHEVDDLREAVRSIA
jgi:diguanylate cyclase (GGDEF)-like protein/PAS domain S-box-containing protein